MQDYERDNILEQYEFAIESTRKTRGAVLCNTDAGLLLLKEINVSEQRIPVLTELYEYLGKQEEIDVDLPVKNAAGEYVTKLPDGRKYLVRRQPAGRECDVKHMQEILQAARNLARLHLLMRKKLDNPVSATEALDEVYARYRRGFRKVRSYVRKVSPKGELESLFLQNYDQMDAWMEAALSELRASAYRELLRRSVEEHQLVHGEYNYHNVLILPDGAESLGGQVSTTNFDRFHANVQVEDLYYFLRKTLEKQGYKERVGEGILNAYSAICPLGEEELEYLKIRFICPEKMWKIVNSYYQSNKAWISSKSIEKMQNAVRQTREKERFLQRIFAFHL